MKFFVTRFLKRLQTRFTGEFIFLFRHCTGLFAVGCCFRIEFLIMLWIPASWKHKCTTDAMFSFSCCSHAHVRNAHFVFTFFTLTPASQDVFLSLGIFLRCSLCLTACWIGLEYRRHCWKLGVWKLVVGVGRISFFLFICIHKKCAGVQLRSRHKVSSTNGLFGILYTFRNCWKLFQYFLRIPDKHEWAAKNWELSQACH
jgi:hypothetical protein